MSHLEQLFADRWLSLYPDIDLQSEYRIIPDRKYRWDFVHLPSKVAIEINGGIWVKSGHSSGTGLLRDYRKLCLAANRGWRVFVLAGEMITDEYSTFLNCEVQSFPRSQLPPPPFRTNNVLHITGKCCI